MITDTRYRSPQPPRSGQPNLTPEQIDRFKQLEIDKAKQEQTMVAKKCPTCGQTIEGVQRIRPPQPRPIDDERLKPHPWNPNYPGYKPPVTFPIRPRPIDDRRFRSKPTYPNRIEPIGIQEKKVAPDTAKTLAQRKYPTNQNRSRSVISQKNWYK